MKASVTTKTAHTLSSRRVNAAAAPAWSPALDRRTPSCIVCVMWLVLRFRVCLCEASAHNLCQSVCNGACLDQCGHACTPTAFSCVREAVLLLGGMCLLLATRQSVWAGLLQCMFRYSL